MLECVNNAYYTGYTTDIMRRLQEHAHGTSKCKYTRSFPPRSLAACWELSTDLSQVLKIEKLIKKQLPCNKRAITLDPEVLSDLLKRRGFGQEVIDGMQYYFSISGLSLESIIYAKN